jgi:amino acid transporter
VANKETDKQIAEDVQVLHSMGYAQELARRMRGFSNFAVAFSIICILSGGINSVAQAISGVGGAAIGFGWPLGCLISLIFALCMAQIASAYPTAGGLYHWGSILGGRGWGWVTAWLNLLGLVTVLAAINVGTYFFFLGAFGPSLGMADTYATKLIFLVVITSIQALVNHMGIGLTTKLTDFSGYLIFAVSIILTIALFAYAPSWDFSRLFTFTNYSGPTGGDVWPAGSMWTVFLLGLLLPIYTITGYDASAHTAEETIGAAKAVPNGIVSSVLWSGLFGWLMLIAFVIAIPNMNDGAAQGWNVFFWTMDSVIPAVLKQILYVGIFICQFICGLATVTSASRMIFAFARDGGLPGSSVLRAVHSGFRTPVAAIWTAAIVSVLFTLYSGVYSTIVSVTVILLFISYALPIILGFFAYGRSWTKMGPWSMGGLYRVVAFLVLLASIFIFFVGIQPPNDKALWFVLGFFALTAIVWFAFENRRFEGPPIGDKIQKLQKDIVATEKNLGAGD